MTPRFYYNTAAPDGYKQMHALHQVALQSDLDPRLIQLIEIRASQINGCAFCVDMHTREAKAAGETDQRLHTIVAWEETPFFSPAERAVLAFTERMTLISQGGVPDEVYDELRQHFDEKQIAALITAVVSINGWNRIAISTRMQPAAV